MSQRLLFLDGLRGWAAFLVMLLHIYLQILPPIDISRLYLHLWWPFTGHFSVALFFLVSGFSLSIGFLKKGDKRMVMRTAVGRYLRLVIPIFFTCALASTLLNTGLIPSPENRPPDMARYFTFDPTFQHLVRFSLFDVFFDYSRDQSYAPPLWTMSFELFGSIIIAALLLVFGAPSKSWPVYFVITALFFLYSPWYSLFILGIASIETREWLLKHAPGWIGIVLMIAGAVVSVISKESTQLLVIAATLFFVGAMQSASASAFFSNRFSQILGEISFPLYLVHVPVTFAVGVPLFVQVMDSNALRFGAGTLAVITSISVAFAFIPINTWAMQVSRWVGRTVISDKHVSGKTAPDQ